LILGTNIFTPEAANGAETGVTQICINEFMASNINMTADEDGDYDDWIEIYNPTDREIDVGGFYISDHEDDPFRWQIPGGNPEQTTIPPGGFLVLWADEEPEEGPLHLGFKLSSSGENIILTSPDKMTVIDRVNFDSQRSCISYGRVPDGGKNWEFFVNPTPGASNSGLSFASLEKLNLYQAYAKNRSAVTIIAVLISLLLLLAGVLYYSRLKLKKVIGEQTLLLDNIQTQVWYLKDICTYVKANWAHCEFLGKSREELENRSLYDFLSKDEAETCVKGNRAVFDIKKQVKTEEWILNKEGEKRLLAITRIPKLTKDKRVEYVVCSAEDITKQRKNEEKLRKLLVEYETIFNKTQDGIFLIDVGENNKFTFRRLNPEFERITGLTTAAVRGKTPVEVAGEELGAQMEANYRNCIEENRAISYREELEFPVGKRIYDTRLSPVTVNGKVVQIVGITRDITDLVSVQKELEKKGKQYQNLVENINDVIFTVDLQGRFMYISSNIEKLSGYTSEELLGKAFAQLVYPDDLSLFQEGFKKILKNAVEPVEFRIVTRNGQIKYVRASGQLVTENNEKPEVTGSMSDVSEKKRAELKLQEYATYDALTGVYNRRVGLAILEEKRKTADRENSVFSICYVDMDNLKMINDDYGHKEGDSAIISAVDIMKSSIRDADVICRLGGDEFLLIFPGCSLRDAEIICARIEQRLNEFNSAARKPYKIKMSLGLAEYRPLEKVSIEELIFRADRKMYERKRKKEINTQGRSGDFPLGLGDE